jgi:DNA polymerase-1
MKIVFDIETDGLLTDVSRLFVIGWKDADSDESGFFLAEDNWQEFLSNADMLIGHNIAGYDLPALEKLYGFKYAGPIFDTMLWSQILLYKRFGFKGHSLESWGELLDFPKIEFDDFSELSEEMVSYCINDVLLTDKVFHRLSKEVEKRKNKYLPLYVKAEHVASEWVAKAEMYGWKMDLPKAFALFEEMTLKLEEAERAFKVLLGWKSIPGEQKEVKHTKDGLYFATMAKRFNVPQIMGLYDEEDKLILGPYCNVDFAERNLGSLKDVKEWLFSVGWQPTEFNWKDGQQMSPKITEDSLEFLGEKGKMYLEYLTIRARYSILKTWLEDVDSEGRLHGSTYLIGTPSLRARHTKIANIPSAQAVYGKEVRELFITEPGWKIIGADSSGNQARGLAWALGDPDFTHEILHGDIHTSNARLLTDVLKGMSHDQEVTRAQAKRILYAFLFGASGAKLWSYIFGTLNSERGERLKKGFMSAVKGFTALVDKLNKEYEKNKKKYGDGAIFAPFGPFLFVDSPHKILVYYLQAIEKATCVVSLALCKERLEEAGIPYRPLVFYHDEIEFEVPEEFAVQAAKIAANAFKEGPMSLGVDIMDGESKVGNNWYEVH